MWLIDYLLGVLDTLFQQFVVVCCIGFQEHALLCRASAVCLLQIECSTMFTFGGLIKLLKHIQIDSTHSEDQVCHFHDKEIKDLAVLLGVQGSAERVLCLLLLIFLFFFFLLGIEELLHQLYDARHIIISRLFLGSFDELVYHDAFLAFFWFSLCLWCFRFCLVDGLFWL